MINDFFLPVQPESEAALLLSGVQGGVTERQVEPENVLMMQPNSTEDASSIILHVLQDFDYLLKKIAEHSEELFSVLQTSRNCGMNSFD